MSNYQIVTSIAMLCMQFLYNIYYTH